MPVSSRSPVEMIGNDLGAARFSRFYSLTFSQGRPKSFFGEAF
jgi:hypothetical protein